jgi:hypothetical protein
MTLKRKSRKGRTKKNRTRQMTGGTQTHFLINFSGVHKENNTKWSVKTTTVGRLVNYYKKYNLYHRRKLISTYPPEALVYNVLFSDDSGNAIYNVTTTNKSSQTSPPPEYLPTSPKSPKSPKSRPKSPPKAHDPPPPPTYNQPVKQTYDNDTNMLFPVFDDKPSD